MSAEASRRYTVTSYPADAQGVVSMPAEPAEPTPGEKHEAIMARCKKGLPDLAGRTSEDRMEKTWVAIR